MSADQTLPVLVLMPGLDGTGKLFTAFVKELSPTVECAVVAYPKDKPMGYADLEGLVESALPRDRPFVLLGESFSGPLAIRIAARAPAGLIGLILSASFVKNPYPFLQRASWLVAYVPVKGLPRWVRAPLMWGSMSPSAATSRSERAMSGVSADVIRRRIADLLKVNETAALRQVRVPTLALRAMRDRVISKRASQIIVDNSQSAKLVEIDGPHLLLQSRAAECAAAVINYLRSLHIQSDRESAKIPSNHEIT
jgi:pimeloyl-ACP methyl ester carboxylesterase